MSDTTTLLHRALALIVGFQVNLHNRSAAILAEMRAEFEKLVSHVEIDPNTKMLLAAAQANAENQPMHTCTVIPPTVALVTASPSAVALGAPAPVNGGGVLPPPVAKQQAQPSQPAAGVGEGKVLPGSNTASGLNALQEKALGEQAKDAGTSPAGLVAVGANAENQAQWDAGMALARAGKSFPADGPQDGPRKHGFDWETAAMKEEAEMDAANLKAEEELAAKAAGAQPAVGSGAAPAAGNGSVSAGAGESPAGTEGAEATETTQGTETTKPAESGPVQTQVQQAEQ